MHLPPNKTNVSYMYKSYLIHIPKFGEELSVGPWRTNFAKSNLMLQTLFSAMIPNLQDAWEVEGLEIYEPFTATVAPQVDNETTQQTPNL